MHYFFHNHLSTHISVEPSDLELTGPTLVEANGEAGRYECRTSGADPPARLAWTLFDRTGQDLTHLLQVSMYDLITETTKGGKGWGWTKFLINEPFLKNLSTA
jgi:hypothetical protein